MTLKPGDRGVDTSGYALDPAQLVKDGGKFRIRYSAGVGNSQPATQWKLCGPGEVKAAIAAGLDFIANSEWYESRITEGAAAGHADGLADLVFWKARGLAQGASIYVSWDAQPVPAKWAAVDSYLAAYELALAGYYHVDCYAGTPYLKHALAKGLIRYGWRPNAGAWSGDGIPYQPAVNADLIALAASRTPAHIVQTGNYWYGKQADENVIVRTPVGSHLDALDRPAPPHPKPPPPPPPPPKPPVTPNTPGGLSMSDVNTILAKLAELEKKVTDLETRFVGSDGHSHTIESTVAHVTKSLPYLSRKGQNY